jgi:hypothetical protein
LNQSGFSPKAGANVHGVSDASGIHSVDAGSRVGPQPDDGGARGRYFGITLRPKGIGWGHRTAALERLLRTLEEYPDLWNATGAECAAHWSLTFPPETALRLEPSIWTDHEGSLS